MKPELRLAWFYCTLFPVQRWLGIVAFALSALFAVFVLLAVFGEGTGGTGDLRPIVLPAFMTPVIFVMPAVFAAGAFFRYVSAPHTHRLLPGLRRKVLGSIVLFAGVVIAFGWALVLAGALLAEAAPGARAMPVGPAMFLVLAGISGMLYFVFLLTHASRWTLVVVVGFLLGLQLLGRLTDLFEAYPGLPWILMALVLLGWVAFGLWYLRVPRIAPADWAGGNMSAQTLKASARGLGRAEAGDLLLTGRMPFRLASAVLGTAVLGILLGFFLRWILAEDAWTDRASNQMEIALITAIGAVSAIIVNGFGSRARYLWLLESGARIASLRRIERVGLRYGIVWLALIASAMASMHLIFPGYGIGRVVAGVVLALGFFPLVAYASLVRCRNFGLGEIGLITLVCFVWIGLYVFVIRAGGSPGFVALMGAAEVVAALLLRALVIRRWRRVDWLSYRVARPADASFRFFGGKRASGR